MSDAEDANPHERMHGLTRFFHTLELDEYPSNTSLRNNVDVDPDPFLAQGNPHMLTLVNPKIAAHQQARLLKRQAKIKAAEERRIYHEQKLIAKAARHEAREKKARIKKEEKKRTKIEHDHRKEDDRNDRAERKQVKEAQRARRRSLMSHRRSDAQAAARAREQGTERSLPRARRQRRNLDASKAKERIDVPGRGVAWGFDPNVPEGGLETGGPGREFTLDDEGHDLNKRR